MRIVPFTTCLPRIYLLKELDYAMMTVERISWERIHLSIELRTDNEEILDGSVHFYLVNSKKQVKTRLYVKEQDGERFTITMNITNSGINRCVPNGTYRLMAVRDGYLVEKALFFGKPEDLSSWSRHFNYNSNKGIYTVTFMVAENTADPEFVVLIFNARASTYSDKVFRGSWVKKQKPKSDPPAVPPPPPPLPERIVKKIKSRLRAAKRKLKARVKRVFNKYKTKFKDNLYRKTREKYKNAAKPHILFLSDKNSSMGLNMETLYRRMLERGMDKDYVIDVCVHSHATEKITHRMNIEALRLIAMANVIIVDDHYAMFNTRLLDESTRLIQIWHAGAGFKGVGYSRWGHFGCPGLFSAHRQYTYCVSGSKAISHFFSEQFGILDEQVIPTGMPRMDEYLDPTHIEQAKAELYERYPQFKDRFVVLFAPTYRGQTRKSAHYPYELIDFDGLYQYCLEKDAVILFKMHPWVPGDVPIPEQYSDRFFSLNDYRSINDLFYITDLMITDYSSSMYEFLLMKKPMLFFPFDKNQFATSRGFHRDYDSNVPGKICESFDLLLQAMRDEDYEYEKVERMLGEYFDNVDTHNCDRVIDWLILDQLPEEYREALDNKRAEIRAFRSIVVKSPKKPTPLEEDAVPADGEGGQEEEQEQEQEQEQ